MILSSLTQTRTSDDIADQLRALIQSGELAKGDRLPPQRELATTLGIGRQATPAVSEMRFLYATDNCSLISWRPLARYPW